MSATPDISVERFLESDGDHFNVKLSTPDLELNVLVRPEEADLLGRVRGTPWESGSLRIGTTAGVPAWWCAGEPRHFPSWLAETTRPGPSPCSSPLETIDAIITEVRACP